MTTLTLTRPVPAALTNFSVIELAGSAVLSWDSSGTSTDSYQVFESTARQFSTASLIATVATNSYTRTGLTVGTIYYYWVRTINTIGDVGPVTETIDPTWKSYALGSNFKACKLYVYVVNDAVGSATITLDYVEVTAYWRTAANALGSASMFFSTTVTQDATNGSYVWTNPDNARTDNSTSASVAVVNLESDALVFTCSDLATIPDTATIYEIALTSRASSTLAGKQLRAQVVSETGALFPPYAYLNFQSTSSFVGDWQPWVDPTSHDVALVLGGSTGGTATSAATSTTAGGLSWSNPTNVFNVDTNKASVIAPFGGGTTASSYPFLSVTFPNLGIPGSATIRGLTVILVGSQAAPTGFTAVGNLFYGAIQLQNSVNIGTAKSDLITPINNRNFGSSTDLWGASLTPAVFNGGAFTVRLQLIGDTVNIRQQGFIDQLTILVTYTNYDLAFPWYPPEIRDGTGFTVLQTVLTVATLGSAATAGMGARRFVTDATVTTFASTVAGSGANKVPVYSDGTNWLIG